MNRKIKAVWICAALIIGLLALATFLVRGSDSLMVDLRDGAHLQLVHVSVATNHVAHFGTPLQKALFKVAGPRLSRKWTGYRMVTQAQDYRNGNLGVFVWHQVPPNDSSDSPFNYKIRPVSQPRKDHQMFLTTSYGYFALWQLNYWTEDRSDFLVENSRGEAVARFRIAKNKRQAYKISLLPPEPQ